MAQIEKGMTANMKNVLRIIHAVNGTLWGVPMLVLLMGCGAYLTLSLRGFQFTGMHVWMKEICGVLTRREKKQGKGISPCRAVSSALASSIGTGNIVGVATAIAAGGAGAVFWMWISAFLGMAVKYAEIFLAVKFRCKGEKGYYGGAMYYIEKGMGERYKWLAGIFSFSGVFACLGMGAMNQSSSIASVLQPYIHMPKFICGTVLAIIAIFAVSGGIERISGVTAMLVPIMAGMYILGGVGIACISPLDTYGAFCEIITSALAPNAVYGGMAGTTVRSAVRYGVARGVFSNEAGLGTSPIVHAAADAKSPLSQGCWGIFEVFVDTILVCTVTAVVIIGSGAHLSNASGAGMVTLAFEKHFGSFGGVFVAVATVMFALSTILGWSYYGERCISYLFGSGQSIIKAYRFLFVAAVFLGTVMHIDMVWELADMFNGMMMVPNLIAVISLSGIVIQETKTFLLTEGQKRGIIKKVHEREMGKFDAGRKKTVGATNHDAV